MSVHSSSGKGCQFSPWKVENPPNMTGGQSAAAFRTLMCRNKSQTPAGTVTERGAPARVGWQRPQAWGFWLLCGHHCAAALGSVSRPPLFHLISPLETCPSRCHPSPTLSPTRKLDKQPLALHQDSAGFVFAQSLNVLGRTKPELESFLQSVINMILKIKAYTEK